MVGEHNLAQLSSAQLDKVINGVFVVYQMPQLSSAQLSLICKKKLRKSRESQADQLWSLEVSSPEKFEAELSWESLITSEMFFQPTIISECKVIHHITEQN